MYYQLKIKKIKNQPKRGLKVNNKKNGTGQKANDKKKSLALFN